jgi:hypothetical protein
VSVNFNICNNIEKQSLCQISDKTLIEINEEVREKFKTKINPRTRKTIFEAMDIRPHNDTFFALYKIDCLSIRNIVLINELSGKNIVSINKESFLSEELNSKEIILAVQDVLKKVIEETERSVRSEFHIAPRLCSLTLCNLTSDDVNNFVINTDDVSQDQFVDINVEAAAKVDFYFQRETQECATANLPSSTPLTAKKRSSNELSAFEDLLEPNAKRRRTTDDNAPTQYLPHEGMNRQFGQVPYGTNNLPHNAPAQYYPPHAGTYGQFGAATPGVNSLHYNNSQTSASAYYNNNALMQQFINFVQTQPAMNNTSEMNNSAYNDNPTSLYFDPSIELENEFVNGNDEGSIPASSTTPEEVPNDDDSLFSSPLPENPIFDVPTLEEFFGMPPWESTQRTESSSHQSVLTSVSPEVEPKPTEAEDGEWYI